MNYRIKRVRAFKFINLIEQPFHAQTRFMRQIIVSIVVSIVGLLRSRPWAARGRVAPLCARWGGMRALDWQVCICSKLVYSGRHPDVEPVGLVAGGW